jgi:hypothetical protein
MQGFAKKGLLLTAAVSGLLAGAAGAASANATAVGAANHNAGAGSGNQVQLTGNAPINACGDTATGAGGLNVAALNHCINHGTEATDRGEVSHSPGAISGNQVQGALNVPINACGDTVNVLAALDPSVLNGCAIA